MPEPIQMSKVECRNCKQKRWNDGLKCPHCGVYQNPKVGEAVRTEKPDPYWHRVDR